MAEIPVTDSEPNGGSEWGPIAEVIAGLDDQDRARLAASAAPSPASPLNDMELEAWLQGVARAACIEYLDLFLGRRVHTRIRDLQQARLFYLLAHAFPNADASVDTIARLFQLTSREARTLARNTRTVYRFPMAELLSVRVSALLSQAKYNGENREFTVDIRDEALVEYLQELIRQAPGHPDQLEAGLEMHVYRLSVSTIRAICRVSGIDSDNLGLDLQVDEEA